MKAFIHSVRYMPVAVSCFPSYCDLNDLSRTAVERPSNRYRFVVVTTTLPRLRCGWEGKRWAEAWHTRVQQQQQQQAGDGWMKNVEPGVGSPIPSASALAAPSHVPPPPCVLALSSGSSRPVIKQPPTILSLLLLYYKRYCR